MHLAKGKEAATGRSMGTCRFVSAPPQPLYAPLGIRDDIFQVTTESTSC